jgi:hypothetical protein
VIDPRRSRALNREVKRRAFEVTRAAHISVKLEAQSDTRREGRADSGQIGGDTAILRPVMVTFVEVVVVIIFNWILVG